MSQPSIVKITETVNKKKHDVISFLREIVNIPSVTGSEKEVQEKISHKLEELNLKVDVWSPSVEELKTHEAFNPADQSGYEDRPIVVGVLKGVGGGKSLILNGHSDVVSPNGQKWIHGPWSAKIENGKMYGRGVCDMKAGLTSIIMALECIQEAGLEPLGDVIIESVVGEETGGNGTLACIMKGYKADAGIVAEPTNMEIHVAQAGALWFKVTCWGKAAHGAFRQEGVSALEKAIKIHDALLGLEARRLKMVHHKLFEEKYEILPIAINIGILHAGKWFTAVPDEAVFEGRIGLLPGENYKEIEDVFEGVIKEVAVKDDWMKKHPPKVEWLGKWEPAEISIKHPIVDVLSSAYYELAYRKATISGTPGGTDMRLLTIYGETPSLLFGPGSISQCHTVDEFVDVEDLIAATKVIAYAITKWCGVKQF